MELLQLFGFGIFPTLNRLTWKVDFGKLVVLDELNIFVKIEKLCIH